MVGTDEALKPPRLIQARTTRYTIELGRRLRPLEHWFWGDGQLLKPYFAKSMNGLSKGQRIARLGNDPETVQLGNDLVYILGDYSRFDSTQNQSLCAIKDAVYKHVYPYDAELSRMLAWRKINRCRTKTGIRYTCKARLMSGDYDTALGNCIINYSAIVAWSERAGVPVDFIVDGDDSVICCRAGDVNKLLEVQEDHFAKLGLILKSSVVRSIHDVDFCQGKLVHTIEGWRLVRNPSRARKHAAVAVETYTGERWVRWLRSVGECEAATNAGVPIMQSFANLLLRSTSGYKTLHLKDMMFRKAEERVRVLPITDKARATFALSFGISPTMQVHIENELESQVIPACDIAKYLDEAVPLPSCEGNWLHNAGH